MLHDQVYVVQFIVEDTCYQTAAYIIDFELQTDDGTKAYITCFE